MARNDKKVKRAPRKKGGKIIETNIYILTFNMKEIAEKIKIGSTTGKVDRYILNSLRFYNCQRFGHHEVK